MNDALLRSFMKADSALEERKALAAEQVREFGQKPWHPTAPTVEALGQKIVFQDLDGRRYTVHCVQPSGAHARIELSPGSSPPSTMISARARSVPEAEALLAQLVKEERIDDVRPDGYGAADGMTFVRWRHGRMPLD